MEKDMMVHFRVPGHVHKSLEELATRKGVSLSWLARTILISYLEDGGPASVRIPAIDYTGKGDEIGAAFAKE